MKIVNEEIGDILKGKSKSEIARDLEKHFKGPGFYGFVTQLEESFEIRLEPISSAGELSDEINALIETYQNFYDVMHIIKLDTSKPNIIDKYGNDSFNFEGNIEEITTIEGNDDY